MNKSFCSMPWVHVCSTSAGNLQPCCRFEIKHEDKIFIKDLDKNFMNKTRFQQIRKSMINGDYIPECHKCYKEEKIGVQSMRQRSNELYYSKNEIYDLNFKKLKTLEFALDNYCNLQCRMCDSQFSTKLIARDNFLNGKSFKGFNVDLEFLNLIDLSELQEIKLLGGEPFMSPNFETFMNYIIKNTNCNNIRLKIITNGTKKFTKKIIDFLNNFKIIDIIVSLDAYHKVNDYQRFGSDYKKIWHNILEYNQVENIRVKFHPTITIYNSNVLDITLNQLEKHNFFYDIGFVYQQENSLEFVPDDFLNWLLERNQKNNTAYQIIKNFLKESKYNDEKWKLFLNKTKKLDNFYNINLKDYNLELYNFLSKNYNF